MLLMLGSRDEVAGPQVDSYKAYETIGSQRKTRVIFENAGHTIFTNNCTAIPRLTAAGYYGGCSDPVWDMNRVHDLTNHFVTAFLLAELKGDADAAKALAPENVSFTGVKYETSAYGAPKAKLDDATAGKIDAVVKKAMTDYPTPGFAMCVVKDGQVVYNKGFGQADVASNRSVTPQSVFLQASIAKSGTAIAVMQLVEQGKIDLDKPVTTYLPYFTMADARYKEITVRMVLSHRAGLPDTPFPWNVPLDPTMSPLEQATRALSDKQLLSPPGTQFSYSNWGFAVLGDMIAKVSGVPFETYMQKNVLAPLGMKSSSYAMADVSPDLRVTGYNNPVGTPLKSQLDCDARHAPACTLWSSCDDLAKYAQMLLNKGELNGTRILQSASIDAMWKTASATPFGPPYAEYGFGCFLSAADGHRLIGLAGSINGFNAQVNLVPDENLAVIAMNNWYVDVPENTSFPAMSAATDVMNLLLGIKAE
jgi:CubicO group peptidase (beta-lactamase class C family)